MVPQAKQLLDFIKGPAVLDVGCTGHVSKPDSPYWLHGYLRQAFEYVAGVDINEQNIRRLQSMGFDNLWIASAENFQLSQKLDTIVAGELIEHLGNPGLFLENAKAHLKSGGRLVLTTPTPFSLFNILYALSKFPKTCSNPEHVCWFCPQTIRSLVDRYGYQVVHFELIQDYELDNPSFLYRVFARSLVMFGWLLPWRLKCNAMLIVLESR